MGIQAVLAALPPHLAAAVEAVARGGSVDSERVGFGGRPSASHAAFTPLQRGASREQLLALLEHPSPVLRGYLAQHIVEAWPGDAPALYPLLADGRAVTTVSGCTVEQTSVADLICRCLGRAAQAGAGRGAPGAALQRCAADEGLPPALRARAFGLLPEPLVAELRGLAARWLADNDPALLGAALRALPWLPEPLALAARHATSPDPMIRRALALALGGVRDPGAHAALAHLAERDPVPYVRMAAVWALASRPDCDVALLYRIARDGEDARVRDAAIEKLIGRQPGAAAPLVEAALRESGSAGGTLLEKLFAAPPHPAVEALARRIVASSARQLERLNHRAPELAVGYLVDRGAYDAAPAIRNLLAARYIGARTAAAAAAARLGDRAAVAPLEAMLRDENDYARIAAAEALAALGSRASATKIEAAARDVSEWALPAIEAALVALRAAGPKP